jgi:hypothetical protein
MNANSFDATAYVRCDFSMDVAMTMDTAWSVLEAANDLGDAVTVDACRRVIDANLGGSLARQADMSVIVDYFR